MLKIHRYTIKAILLTPLALILWPIVQMDYNRRLKLALASDRIATPDNPYSFDVMHPADNLLVSIGWYVR